jgi:hypothetical protein
MSASGWITLVVVVGFVWGGFALAILTAVRSEARKVAAAGNAGGPSAGSSPPGGSLPGGAPPGPSAPGHPASGPSAPPPGQDR